jgi:hypothetical protein
VAIESNALAPCCIRVAVVDCANSALRLLSKVRVILPTDVVVNSLDRLELASSILSTLVVCANSLLILLSADLITPTLAVVLN